MIDARLVPFPAIFPSACLGCGAATGTMVDTGVERPGIGRVYLCTKLCAPSLARTAGLVEGERMEQLLAGATELERTEREIANREVEMTQMRELIARQADLIERRDDELAAERGRVAVLLQLGDTIADTSDQLRATIAELRAGAVSSDAEIGEPEPEPVGATPERTGIARILPRRDES